MLYYTSWAGLATFFMGYSKLEAIATYVRSKIGLQAWYMSISVSRNFIKLMMKSPNEKVVVMVQNFWMLIEGNLLFSLQLVWFLTFDKFAWSETSDYGHTMAKFLILCGPNSNSNPNSK